MKVSEAAEARFSCRAFRPDPVPLSVLRDILAIAARAPSGGNLQPWRVHCLAGQARQSLVDELAARADEIPHGEGAEYAVYPPDLKMPYHAYRKRCGAMLYEALGIEYGDRAGRYRQYANNFTFFGAPVGLFITIDRSLGIPQWADLGMFIQTLMLLATEHGLHTCAQESWASWPKTLSRHLDLAGDEMVFCGISLGYGDLQHPVNQWRTERAEIDEFTRFHGFE